MFPKPTRALRLRGERLRKLERKTRERSGMDEARIRDGNRCQFPLCTCAIWPSPVEIAHLKHRGMGGNPAGDRSTADRLIALCRRRHQDSRLSLHHGTIEAVPLSAAGMNGPKLWRVNLAPLRLRYVHAVAGVEDPAFHTEWIDYAIEGDRVAPGAWSWQGMSVGPVRQAIRDLDRRAGAGPSWG
jgi:hypothetical protein